MARDTKVTDHLGSLEYRRIDELIVDPQDQPLDEAFLAELSQSLDVRGQIEPILIDRQNLVRDGVYRLELARRQGRSPVPVRVLDVEGLEAEFVRIETRVCRRELTVLERAGLRARQKVVYETLHPETQRGGDRGNQHTGGKPRQTATPAFCQAMAARERKSVRTIEDEVRIGSGVCDQARQLLARTKTSLRKADLLRLAKLPEDEQVQVARRLHEGNAKTLKKALQRVEKRQSKAPPSEVVEPGPVIPGPNPTERAVQVLAEREGLGAHLPISIVGDAHDPLRLLVAVPMDLRDPQPAAILPVAQRFLSAIAPVGRALDAKGSLPIEVPPPMPLDEIARLAPGPLEAVWVSPHLACILRAGVPIAHVPVERLTKRSGGTFIKIAGNQKTRSDQVIVNSCSLVCWRGVTGLPECGRVCYSSEDGSGGCFANTHRWGRGRRKEGHSFEVHLNGVINDLARIRLPADGVAGLWELQPDFETRLPVPHRIDAESADGSQSIAMGIFQSWVEGNPDVPCTTFCAHYFRPNDEMLAWLRGLSDAYGNVWVCHTTSAWFAEEELEHRLAAIERFLDWGIPSVVWVTTHPDWDNLSVARRVQRLVPDTHIIEAPCKRESHQGRPVLGINPLGACADQRVDQDGRRVAQWSPTGEPLVDDGHGGLVRARGSVHAHCEGCRLRCGLVPLGLEVGAHEQLRLAA